MAPVEREFIAATLLDAFAPYGQRFDPDTAGRLVSARFETLLANARAEAWDAGMLAHSEGRGSDANPWREWTR